MTDRARITYLYPHRVASETNQSVRRPDFRGEIENKNNGEDGQLGKKHAQDNGLKLSLRQPISAWKEITILVCCVQSVVIVHLLFARTYSKIKLSSFQSEMLC